ncbi:ABC-type multidrug transport system, ATPase and permease component [Promicromonospora umidemergens]|uniref:ATP-binding cassette domain-containing protein n=1 Tax=Promicromonospora umidemergens TaxID=629679 RepID=UPI0020A2B435|nr:ATP-binding cassette domain-containing protein [Promicromonospora umidemergens]MCP2283062.1 ABC-type multidrug transport system, ATPase and permease component [Promicromonospora umidemergens]
MPHVPARPSRRTVPVRDQRHAPWRRRALRVAAVAVPAALLAAGASSYAAVVTGRMAAEPARDTLIVLAAVSAAVIVLDAVTWLVVQRAVARAEATLRSDLAAAALGQPLPALEEQAVGELLDRVNGDPERLTRAISGIGITLGQAAISLVVGWVAAGLVWWPAWVAFPLVATVVLVFARRSARPLRDLSRLSSEAASDHMAQLEEAVAARDDLRTADGQRYVLRRYAELAARQIRLREEWSVAFSRVRLRTELPLDALVGAVLVGGVWAVTGGTLDVARLVALWLLVTGFVGRVDVLGRLLPRLEEAIGTFQRVRDLLARAQEPVGGAPFPGSTAAPGPDAPGRPTGADVELRDLTFAYGGGFTLGPLSLTVPAGSTCALVGRTGSGKTTLTKMLSRAVDPPAGSVFLDGQDITGLDVHELRTHVGVVGQRTEILAATLADNITLWAPVPAERVEQAVDALGLRAWVRSLPQGLDTRLGSDGVTLSAGEEQLVAFARLLVRDVEVVVLDEATARMDPATAERVTLATQALLAGRTAVVVAHRLPTARHADTVAVLDGGRLVEHGPWDRLASANGYFSRLVAAAGLGDEDAVGSTGSATRPADGEPGRPAPQPAPQPEPQPEPSVVAPRTPTTPTTAGSARAGRGARDDPPARTSMVRAVWSTLRARPLGLLLPAVVWELTDYLTSTGLVVGWLWASLVVDLEQGSAPWLLACAILAAVVANTLLPFTVRLTSARWWADSRLRLRLAVLRGQTAQRRTVRDAPGEIAARAQEEYRLTGHTQAWRELVTAPVTLGLLVVLSDSLLAGAIGLTMAAMMCAAQVLGSRAVAAAARQAGDAAAELGRLLGSALDAVRTVKLSASTSGVLAQVARVDGRRVLASLREERTDFLVGLAPSVLSRIAAVLAWALHLNGTWSLATTLLVSTSIGTFSWIGYGLGQLVTSAASARRWVEVTSRYAGTERLADVPDDVDLFTGAAVPAGRSATDGQTRTTPTAGLAPASDGLRELRLDGLSATHDDGTVGVAGVDLTVRRGELVLVVGRVGSGKSSLLGALSGLVDTGGRLTWNGAEVSDPETFLRPPRVAHVAQVPHVVSGTLADNVRLDHDRPVTGPVGAAGLGRDVAEAGGADTLVGHRGLRLSGGQVQRLGLARALATGSDLLLVDDVSSALDAVTEAEVWSGLRAAGTTVVGTTSRAATLATADRVVVLDGGRVAAVGPWRDLEPRWSHLAG